MSISLGVYEFFSYILPGILYLYIGNEFLGFIGSSNIDLAKLNTVEGIFLLGVAYLIGQIMNVLNEFLWRHVGTKNKRLRNLPEISLERLKRKLAGVSFDFKKDEWDFLLNRLRQDEAQLASHFERFKAVSLMLRNTALALYLWAMLYLVEYVSAQDVRFLLNALGLVCLGFLAAQRSRVFDLWFYNGVYSEALRFGRTTQEVLFHNAKSEPEASNKRRKTKE